MVLKQSRAVEAKNRQPLPGQLMDAQRAAEVGSQAALSTWLISSDDER